MTDARVTGETPMNLLDTLDLLDVRGVTLRLDGHRIKAAGPPDAIDALSDDLRQHRDLLHAHVLGVASGHLLAFCDECGEATITAVKDSSGRPRSSHDEDDGYYDRWPHCRMTPGCSGRHHPRPADLAARANCPAPPSTPRPPAKVDKRRLLGPRPPWPSPPTTTDRSTQ